jgi:hypothetical protein
MNGFEAKCFNTIFSVVLERLSTIHIRYIFQYLSVLLHTVVAVTWGSSCRLPLLRALRRKRKKHFTSILLTFQKTYEEKFPKMAKMTKYH